MKRNQLLVLSVLMFGVQSVASANTESPYPADAEASYNLPAIESSAAAQTRMSDATWGVGKREVQPHNAFPFGGGQIDD